MKKVPRILVPARRGKIGASGPLVDGVNQTYLSALLSAGAAPIIAPITQDEGVLSSMYACADGLLLTGGEDISPEIYGEARHPNLGNTDLERDRSELAILNWAYKCQKPILAICRGLQLINVALGGTLYQDLPTQVGSALEHGKSDHHEDSKLLKHEIEIDKYSKLAQILGVSRIMSNSSHHQALNKVAATLCVVARSSDGIVEAVEDRNRPFLIGVQSHPESIWDSVEPIWGRLFKSFVESA